jgi:hypothetical protein
MKFKILVNYNYKIRYHAYYLKIKFLNKWYNNNNKYIKIYNYKNIHKKYNMKNKMNKKNNINLIHYKL